MHKGPEVSGFSKVGLAAGPKFGPAGPALPEQKVGGAPAHRLPREGLPAQGTRRSKILFQFRQRDLAARRAKLGRGFAYL